jgi:spore coat protein H
MAQLVSVGPRKRQHLVEITHRLNVVWFAMAFAGVICLSASEPQPFKSAQAGDDLFTRPEIRKIHIEIPEAGIVELRAQREWERNANPDDRPSVQATIREGSIVYPNVGLHLKGAQGSFRPVDQNPCFTLNFDKHVRSQRFHGLQKISLNNSVEDPTFLTEKICRELFLKAGVPIPRSDFAVVELNGRPLGLYTLVEGWNKQFLKKHFAKADGNLYDSGFIRDVTARLDQTSGEKSPDQSDLKALAAAALEPDWERRLARLEKVLDVDRFITSAAMQAITWNWDGYVMNINNYRVYHDPATDKLVFLPHGLDQMFSQPNGPILPRTRGLVARSLLQMPEVRQQYVGRVSQLMTNVYHVEAITNRVRQQAARIGPALAEYNPEAAPTHAARVNSLCARIVQRARSIELQLSNFALTNSTQGATPTNTLKVAR